MCLRSCGGKWKNHHGGYHIISLLSARQRERGKKSSISVRHRIEIKGGRGNRGRELACRRFRVKKEKGEKRGAKAEMRVGKKKKPNSPARASGRRKKKEGPLLPASKKRGGDSSIVRANRPFVRPGGERGGPFCRFLSRREPREQAGVRDRLLAEKGGRRMIGDREGGEKTSRPIDGDRID